MAYRDKRCVHVARNLSEAEMTVSFLESHGIEARVIDGNSFGLLDGIAGLAGSSWRGVEVWVIDLSRHAEAQQLLKDDADARKHREAEGQERGPVEVTCEACGKTTKFKGEFFGTIQNCSRCGAYIDVGSDESWESEAEWNANESDENQES
ncbi:MAG: hypothetical protein WD768_13105 [Phycisphaeraceae bacterium]